jgi:antagonist of KipI
MSVTVLKPGMLTTVQDRGRTGFQHLGVPVSGAMDFDSHRLANILAANDSGEATLEVTLQGPRLRFEQDALIALCGAELSPTIDGIPAPEGKAVRVRAGTVIDFGRAVAGCRCYLAIHGGFDVPVVMGSRSTYDTARLGGVEGRALRKTDVLPVGAAKINAYPSLTQQLGSSNRSFSTTKWAVNQHSEQLRRTPQIIRILAGRHWDAFPAASREILTSCEFRIAPDSNRMGCRLECDHPVTAGPPEILSEAVTFGTIQVPPSGKPIVLMADRQTVGGYPKIAEVSTVDLHLLAQLRPGERLRFELTSLALAQALWLKREREIITIREAVDQHVLQ